MTNPLQQPPTLLLVEDEALIAMSEAKMLRQQGYEVVLAASGEEAIAQVKQASQAIALILMDIDLGRGRMDGTEAALEILKDHDIPLLFLSSHSEPEVVEKTEKITSYGYVVKGSNITVLVASIKMAFKLHAAHQALQQEVAERNRTEAALRDSNERFAQFMQHIPGVAFIKDSETRHLFANRNFEEIISSDWQEKTNTEIFPAQIATALTQTDQNILSAKEAIQMEEYAQNRYWLSCKFPIRLTNSILLGGISFDITARKRAEEALRESEEHFRVAIKSTPMVIFNQDLELRYTWVANPHPSFDPQAVLGKTDADLLFEEDAARLTEIKRRVLTTGQIAREEVHTTIDGQSFFYDLTVEPLRDANTSIVGIMGVSMDITARKQVEDKLLENERQWSDLLNKLNMAQQIAKIGNWDWDLPTNQIWWSDETYRIFGVTPADYAPDFETNGKFLHPR